MTVAIEIVHITIQIKVSGNILKTTMEKKNTFYNSEIAVAFILNELHCITL